MFPANTNPISLDEIFYFRERNRSRIYASVISTFSKCVEEQDLTKREIASKLGKEPAQITRWLSGPGNWTLDTVSDLLLAMGGELDPAVSNINAQPCAMESYHPLMRPHTNVVQLIRIDDQHATADHQSGTNGPPIEFRRSAAR
jgi:hypothetical protein